MAEKMIYVFQSNSILLTDPRISDFIKIVKNLEKEEKDTGFAEFKQILQPMYTLYTKISNKQVTISDWDSFRQKAQLIFDKYKAQEFKGKIPKYIPGLRKADKDAFAVSIWTVDGQVFNFGDTDSFVTMQAISSVISYLIALEEHGNDKVSLFIGTEPSGKAFNSLELSEKKPHNPMINSGALTWSHLIYHGYEINRKYEYYSEIVKNLIGGRKVHFNNEIYLSEISTADRNYSLLYMLQEAGIIETNADVKKILQFYTQACAIELSIESYSILASTLANGGICPITDDKVFEDSNAVKGALSQMLSCGMNTYSGVWAFDVGLPAKSSVSGVNIWVVPNTMGIAVYSPPLDKAFNSSKGSKFLIELIRELGYDNIDHVYSAGIWDRKQVDEEGEDHTNDSFHLLYYAKQNKLSDMRRAIAQGMDVNYSDYDSRTPLHLAANFGNFEIVEYLVNHGAKINVQDRFGNSPIDEAKDNGFKKIEKYLIKKIIQE